MPVPMSMRISHLADEPHLAEALIDPLLSHWRTVVPEDTREARRRRFAAHMSRQALPIAWVAHEAGDAFGTASLRASDLDGHDHLTPWLGGVFVRPEFRRRGIASALCDTVAREAQRRGFERIYLFTSDQQTLYARLGWQVVEPVSWRRLACHLMVRRLDAPG